jgi:Tol biopolymer transport system component
MMREGDVLGSGARAKCALRGEAGPGDSIALRCASLVLALVLAACQADTPRERADEVPLPARAADGAPFGGLIPADELIRPEERHFARLWRVTDGIFNAAEGYWSFAGDRIVSQITRSPGGCDQIFVTDPRGGALERLSNGMGVTTCAYFLPGDRSILYASTHAWHRDCPPPPDRSQGYVWNVHPEYDVYVRDLASGAERVLLGGFGYDAEATVSPKGDRIVFTSTRSGDLELWTCALDGSDLRQVTHSPGYDGGAFFSPDGEWLVFRSTAFTPGKEAEEEAEYARLLGQWKVRPARMELQLCRADGSERRQLTQLGKANWAPFFFPDGRRLVFASNHHDERRGMPNFDLFAIGTDGQGLERVTFDPDFDAFPVFSPDGRWLCFASNRGGSQPGETNLFVAAWR